MVQEVLTACRVELDSSAQGFGPLRESTEWQDYASALRDRLEEDGYLFIRGFYNEGEVLRARRSILARLAAEGNIDLNFPIDDAMAIPDLQMAFRPEFANKNKDVEALLYSEKVMEFYSGLFGETARHYDFTWLRAMAPGANTFPHVDQVYMGRGTPNVLTLWTPLGNVPIRSGGLMVLENSHKDDFITGAYAPMDVDAFCENKPGERQTEAAGYKHGAFSFDPRAVQTRFGGRWLSADYRIGDLLTFKITLMHASLDNHSKAIRLSTDSRYQPASQPADERWVGENPPAHGDRSHRNLIC
ncbi:MAG: phytanoyl-CoA dioxygenase family protein [Fimbriimonas sp.]